MPPMKALLCSLWCVLLLLAFSASAWADEPPPDDGGVATAEPAPRKPLWLERMEGVPPTVPPQALGARFGGGLGTAIALERARTDLYLRGVRVPGAALWVGHGMLITGLGACLFGLPLALVGGAGSVVLIVGMVLTPLAMLPYAVNTAQVLRAYKDLAREPTARRSPFSIGPAVDVGRGTIGVTGTF